MIPLNKEREKGGGGEGKRKKKREKKKKKKKKEEDSNEEHTVASTQTTRVSNLRRATFRQAVMQIILTLANSANSSNILNYSYFFYISELIENIFSPLHRANTIVLKPQRTHDSISHFNRSSDIQAVKLLNSLV